MNHVEIVAIAAGVTAIVWFVYFSNKAIVTTGYKLKIFDGSGKGLRIVQVSDLQSRSFGRHQSKLLQRVAAERPDIIVITGDLIDRNFTDYGKAMDAVKGLCDIAKVLYVQGNHEQSLDKEKYGEFLGEAGKYMEILFCDRYLLTKDGKKFCIGGLSEDIVDKSRGYDRDNRNYDEKIIIKTVEEIFDKVECDGKILLSHEPQLIDLYEKTCCDIVLCGHAHGGQFRIPFVNIGLYSPEQGIFPKYYQGIHTRRRKDGGKITMVISRGLGNSKFPLRLFNRPEIVVIDVM